jgi:hypothetical protein
VYKAAVTEASDSAAAAVPVPPLTGSDQLGSQPFASISEHLAPGEGVVAYCDALVKEGAVIFDKCKVVLTRYRLIVIKHGWPWGYKVDKTYPRETCSVFKHKERLDGSQLVVVKEASTEHPLCLYFGRHEKDEAEIIRAELQKGAV